MSKKLNFTFEEFFKSDIAKKNNINNTTSNPKHLNNWMNLVVFCLQPIRDKLVSSKKSSCLNITGAFRSPQLVKFLGSETTGHPDGECADLSAPNMTQLDLFHFIIKMIKNNEIEVDQLIYEYDTNCVHIGYRTTSNRHQIMTRKIVNGKYIYTNVDISKI